MKASVINFRGISSAVIEMKGISLIAGMNGSGKSSLAMAVGAALTGNALPFSGMRKNDAGILVLSGKNEAKVEITGDSGNRSIVWPSCSALSSGTPPESSAIAVGMEKLSEQNRLSDRTKLMAPYIKAEPSETDLQASLQDIDPGMIKSIQEKIAVNGWDQAWEQAKSSGQQLKGEWRGVTGITWGNKQGPAWKPQGWVDALANSTEEKLVGWVSEANTLLEAGIKSYAITSNDIDRFRALAEEKIDENAHSDMLVAQSELTMAKEERAKLPPDKDPNKYQRFAFCPHKGCGKQVIVNHDSTLSVPGEFIGSEELKQRGRAIASAEGVIANKTDNYNRAKQRSIQAAAKEQQIKEAKLKLAEIENRPASEFVDVEAYRAKLADRTIKLEAFKLKTRADAINKRIEQNIKIIEVLAPEGLRAVKQREGIAEFNNHLIEASKLANWGPVEISSEMVPMYCGRIYPICSESEQLRIDVTIQVVCARLDHSSVVVIDRVDTLDKNGFIGLIKLLRGMKIPAIVCSTYGDPDRPPKDFQVLGIGQTYWMENGQAIPFNQKVQKAA